MGHRDNDVPLLVPSIDVPVRFGHPFQRVTPINNRLYCSSLEKLPEETKTVGVFASPPTQPGYHPFAASPGNPWPTNQL